MTKTCGGKCVKAPTPDGEPRLDAEGRKIMVACHGNKKFPEYFEHAQCQECHLDELLEDIKWKQKSRDMKLFAQLEELKKKSKK